VFADFALTPEQDAALEAHLELLMRWNKTLNLTAIRNREEAIERHYCEALFLGARLPAGALRIADIGSGAGFPGFPVAVLRRECSVTLIESHQRKSVFLREASRKMLNVRVLAKRAEDVDEEFDWVISRAVSYEDLTPILKRLGPNAASLGGAEGPPSSLGFSWDAPVALPWGNQRFLWIGAVSRET
jgi:16S rRNA (guanine(527)-N(7))-methyltransferase RsmG